MAKSLESPTTLTEFAPLHSEVQSEVTSGIRSTFARWFGMNKSGPPLKEVQEVPSLSSSRDDVSLSGESITSSAMYSEGRTLVNVLTRVSNLLAPKGMYNEAEFKNYWMPDSVSKECYECSYKFTALRRRHHCRICGQIFCSRCCQQQVPGKLMGYSGDLRACTYCCHIVLSCLQSVDLSSDLSTDLTRVQEDLKKKLALLQPEQVSSSSGGEAQPNQESKGRKPVLKRKISVSFQEERFSVGSSSIQTSLSSDERRVLLHDSIQLKALHEELIHPQRGITFQTHRYKLRSMTNCCAGSEIVDWLLGQDKATSRMQAVAIGQALIDANFLECLSNTEQTFIDGYSLYRPKLSESIGLAQQIQDTQEPLWVRQIGMQEDSNQIQQQVDGAMEQMRKIAKLDSSNEATATAADTPVDCNHLDLMDSFKSFNAPNKKAEQLNPLPLLNSPTYQQVELSAQTKESKVLNDLFNEHTQRLMKQLLSSQGLSLSWAEILMPLVNSLAFTVRPDVKNDDDDLDIRQYVHIKKVAGASKSDSRIIHGVVCSKNVANRSMAKRIHDPNILLLSSAIDYQRVENKLISLEPLMMQENEYLKNAVAKIAAFRPEVLLVEKVVSGLAQEFLLNLGVTLVLNVRPSVMDRISRYCQADIVPSIDAHITKPRLGSCRLFHIETVHVNPRTTKTLMFFDGCQPRLGSTVLLRGASFYELRKVKKVFRFMLFACYNARLERAFLADEFAIPKIPGVISEIFEVAGSPITTSATFPLPPQNSILENEMIIIDGDSSVSPSSPGDQHNSTVLQLDSTPKIAETATSFKCVSELDDPLHEYLRICQGDPSTLGSTPIDMKIGSLSVQTSSHTSTSMLFRKAMEDTILNVSPLVRHGLPYLETEAGRNAPVRRYLPEVLYFSQQLKHESPPRKSKYEEGNHSPERFQRLSVNERNVPENLHPFLRVRITPDMSKKQLLALLSDFRARGVRPRTGDKPVIALKAPAISDERENTAMEQEQQHPDCLNPFNLQRLCVLFSSSCHNVPNASHFCVSPWVVEMDFYGRNDIALGGFLERYCFHANYTCPSISCQAPITSHVRRFVHANSSILVILRQLANPVNSNVGLNDDRTILMWSWCKKCKQVSPIATMSNETWHFSFAKYLELRFHGNAYYRRQMSATDTSTLTCACSHPLHTEHFHYFGCRDLVASFKFTPITLKEISLSPVSISIGQETELLPRLVEGIRLVAQCGYGLHAVIAEWLSALMLECTATKLETSVGHLIDQQVQERARFRKRVEEIQLMMTSPDMQKQETADEQPLGNIQNALWDILDHEVLLKRVIAETVNTWNSRLQDIITAKKKEDKSFPSMPRRSILVPNTNTQYSASSLVDDKLVVDIDVKARRVSDADVAVPSIAIMPICSAQEEDSRQSVSLSNSPTNRTGDFRFRSSSEFLTLSPSAEREREILIESDENRRSVSQSSGAETEAVEIRQHEIKTIPSSYNRVSLSTLLSMTGPGPSLLTSPFPSSEHHLLPPGSSVPLVVYQNEPSSIIAYALSSVDYENQLIDLKTDLLDQSAPLPSQPIRLHSQLDRPDRWFDNVEREEPSGKHSVISSSVSLSSTGASNQGGPYSSNQHLEIQFSDTSTKFYCRIYYAQQFRHFRSKVFPAGELRFVRSLSRCVPWAASGGKSGSTFCKTLDDRFVLKQMSKMEIQSFLDLAPNYIAYTLQANHENRPTAFCKVVGAFRIVFKNTQTNVASKQDLLVMENLFYNRNVKRKFDLKGSERNRLISASEAEMTDCVLLDENFMKIISENPLYIRGHSQGVLNKALNSDTEFLASQLVMDYSLLVGIDEETSQLIVGIIDYIRTFTWDKRLETFVKSSGILGGQGKMPTVVSPELYRTRFCEAMNRYFLGVPDKWTGLTSSS